MVEEVVKPELSLKEKERRWSLLQAKLKGAGLSALLVYGGSQLGVPVHYLAKIWGTVMNMVIFPVEEEPVFLIPSNSGQTPQKVVESGCWINVENIRLSPNLAADAARQNLELVADAYRRGVLSIQDLLDAQNAALVADQRAANAVYDFLMDLENAQRAISLFMFMSTPAEMQQWFKEFQEYYAQAQIPDIQP